MTMTIHTARTTIMVLALAACTASPGTDTGSPQECPGQVDVTDADGDGYTADVDCDDNDADVGDGLIWYPDWDEDGHGDSDVANIKIACEQPWMHTDANNDDCDDRRDYINPDAEEICDGRDNDCDGAADDNIASNWYLDADGDGFGSYASQIHTCDIDAITVSIGVWIEDNADCDDSDATVYPGSPYEESDCDEL